MLLIDSSVLVAIALARDPMHDGCTQLLETRHDPLVTCSPAITEASFVIRRLGGLATAARFVKTFETNDIDLEPITKQDLGRVGELLDRYADLRLDFTDAVLIALAERLGVTEIATLDRRDFSVVRPRHVEALTLLP